MLGPGYANKFNLSIPNVDNMMSTHLLLCLQYLHFNTYFYYSPDRHGCQVSGYAEQERALRVAGYWEIPQLLRELRCDLSKKEGA